LNYKLIVSTKLEGKILKKQKTDPNEMGKLERREFSCAKKCSLKYKLSGHYVELAHGEEEEEEI
jgi:hypothetical protein